MANIQQSFFFNITNYLLPFCKNYAETDVLRFNKAIRNYNDHVIYFDKIIDGDIDYTEQYKKGENYFSAYHHQYKQSLFLLLELFPAQSSFWQVLAQYENIYYDTLLYEKYIKSAKPLMTLSDFERVAIGKHSLAFVPVKGMEILCNMEQDGDVIGLYEKIFCAMQMLDDIEDFEEDRQNAQWNYAHSLVNTFIKENDVNKSGFGEDFYLRVFYASDIAQQQTIYAIEKFSEAYNMALQMKMDDLSKWIAETIKKTEQNILGIKEIVA